jgi:PhoPQ-activated pathogenicity-related protein
MNVIQMLHSLQRQTLCLGMPVSTTSTVEIAHFELLAYPITVFMHHGTSKKSQQ